MEWFSAVFSSAQQWLFEALVQPAFFAMGMGNLLENAFDATGWLLVGLLQIAVLLVVISPLQHWRPAEPVTDRAAVRNAQFQRIRAPRFGRWHGVQMHIEHARRRTAHCKQ